MESERERLARGLILLLAAATATQRALALTTGC